MSNGAWAELAHRMFHDLFVGRRDDFLRAKKERPQRAGRAMTERDIEAHLAGEFRVSPYILSPDLLNGLGCRFGCLEFGVEDPGPAQAGWKWLADRDLPTLVERTATGRHRLWLLVNEAVPVVDARKVLETAARELAAHYPTLTVTAGNGKFKRLVTVLPTHNALKGSGYGSSAPLPLHAGSLEKDRTTILDPATMEPTLDQITAMLTAEQADAKEIQKIARGLPVLGRTGAVTAVGGGPLASARHPNRPRVSGLEIIMRYLLSPNGPLFVWRRGKITYSQRDGQEYTPGEFTYSYDPVVLGMLLADAEEITDEQARSPNPYSRFDRAIKVWRMWAPVAFRKIRRMLPERGRVDGTTAEEEAMVVPAVRKALTKEVRVQVGETGFEPASLLRYALKYGGYKWQQLGNQGAWYKRGPEIAVSYDFLITHGGVGLERFKRDKLLDALKEFGVVRSDRIKGGKMRAWVIEDKWLADQLEVDAFAFDDDNEPEPFDAKKAAAGDTDDKDEIPF